MTTRAASSASAAQQSRIRTPRSEGWSGRVPLQLAAGGVRWAPARRESSTASLPNNAGLNPLSEQVQLGPVGQWWQDKENRALRFLD